LGRLKRDPVLLGTNEYFLFFAKRAGKPLFAPGYLKGFFKLLLVKNLKNLELRKRKPGF